MFLFYLYKQLGDKWLSDKVAQRVHNAAYRRDNYFLRYMKVISDGIRPREISIISCYSARIDAKVNADRRCITAWAFH